MYAIRVIHQIFLCLNYMYQPSSKCSCTCTWIHHMWGRNFVIESTEAFFSQHLSLKHCQGIEKDTPEPWNRKTITPEGGVEPPSFSIREHALNPLSYPSVSISASRGLDGATPWQTYVTSGILSEITRRVQLTMKPYYLVTHSSHINELTIKSHVQIIT
jgi:hypothetical protein